MRAKVMGLLGGPSQVVGRDNHCGMFAFGLRNGLGEVRDGLCKRLQLSAIRQFDRLIKTPGPRHNATPTNEKRPRLLLYRGREAGVMPGDAAPGPGTAKPFIRS